MSDDTPSPDDRDRLPYVRMSFKGNKVWVAADQENTPVVENGKVRIKYNLNQDYEYQVKVENLRPVEEAVRAKPRKKPSASKSNVKDRPKTKKQTGEGVVPPQLDPECINIFTDGASSGNPGPSGIGVLMVFGDHRKEISRFIGTATNNIAELTAILVALDELKRKDLPVRLFTDSTYSIGVLTLNWKPKKNQDLVEQIKLKIEEFKDVELVKVKGHAGIKENEVADFLATSAIKEGKG